MEKSSGNGEPSSTEIADQGMPSSSQAPVKFALPISSKRKPPRQQQKHSDDVEFVSSVDADGIRTQDGALARGRQIRVIPRIENSWKPQKKMKNLSMSSLTITNNGDQDFEMEIQSAGAEDGVQYGLCVRSSAKGDANIDPLILKTREALKAIEKEVLMQDLLNLPEEATLMGYESMPVEDFGEAMLRGMGWETGKAIGRRMKPDVQPIQYVPRAGREGLGADPAPPKEEVKKKFLKPGESREPKQQMVAPLGPDGKIRHVVGIDEKLVPRSSSRSATASAAAANGSSKAAAAAVESNGKERRRERESSGERRRQETEKSWLMSDIRVRIVSKRFQGGKMYLKKGKVVDVVTPTVCDVVMDESGEIVQQVRQDYLETALPRRGGRVIVVRGKQKGCVGKLIEKDQENETGVVQMEESLKMVSMGLDYLAEFLGDAADTES